MKKHLKIFLACVLSATSFQYVAAEKLVILHTNDTHSQIDPNDKDLGGVLRRKVIIDSVRSNNRNTLLVDAGDAVQGTMFFNLFGGEVEYKMLDLLGYDMAIVGNHDFDNGSEKLAPLLKKNNLDWISTNYDTSGGPLDGIFKPYVIKEYDGRRIGFIGLNLRPKGMISEGNYNGVEYLDAIKAANATAWHLKHNEKVDLVVALSHLGYNGKPEPKDVDVAANSEDIDIIIGGHSHTMLDPADRKTRVKNLDGRDVLITQVGKSGMNMGQVTIDLDSLTSDYTTIAVDKRLDSRINRDLADVITPYRHGVDSLMQIKVGRSAVELDNLKPGLLNFISDFALDVSKKLTGKTADMALMNKGSLRHSLPKGDITMGMIMMMQPFNNHFEIIEISGKDLLEAFDVMAGRGGDGVSRGVDATIKDRKCVSVTLDGRQIDPEKTYRVITIDYLANGGDYMEPLTRGKVIARSPRVVYEDLLDYFATDMEDKDINPETKARMHR